MIELRRLLLQCPLWVESGHSAKSYERYVDSRVNEKGQ